MNERSYRKTSTWSSRNVVVACVVVFLLFVVVGLIVRICTQSQTGLDDNSTKTTSEVCLTPACVIAAAKILNTIDSNVDPCQNFYSFACGTNTSDDLKTLTRLATKQYLSIFSEDPKPMDSVPAQNLKYLYKMCMNLSEIDLHGLGYVRQAFKELGGWPVLEDDWMDDGFDFVDHILVLRRKGYECTYLFGTEFHRAEQNMLKLTVPMALENKDINRDQYVNYMVRVARGFGAEFRRAYLDMQAVYNFRTKLHKIYEDAKSKEQPATPHQVKHLQQKLPQINWLHYLNEFYYPLKFSKETMIAFGSEYYTKALLRLLDETPKHVQANYLMWEVVDSMMAWMPKEIRESKVMAKSTTVVLGQSPEEPDRRVTCIRELETLLPVVAECVYVEKYSRPETVERTIQVIEEIKAEYVDMLEKSERLENSTKKQAISRLKSMKYFVAGRSSINENILDGLFYAHKKISGNASLNYVQILEKVRYEFYNFMASMVNQSPEYEESLWLFKQSSATVNAYYSPENIMVIPTPILQDAFFNPDFPDYMIYSGLAYITGHEISHAFFEDTQNSTSQCLLDLYENYVQEKFHVKVNGSRSSAENTADLIGLHVAYTLFAKNYLRRNNSKLPGLQQYTPEQLFWVSNARWYCDQENGEDLNLTTHGVRSFRVEGPASQLYHFAKDFNCPLGSPMNPKNRCSHPL